MDELELRIQGHELALIEVVAFVDEAAIRAGMAAIAEQLTAGITLEERTIRLQALELLDLALRRYDPPAAGMHWRGAQGS